MPIGMGAGLAMEDRRTRRGRARLVGSLAAFVALAGGLLGPGGAAGFDLADVAERARKLAAEPFREPKSQVPDWLLKITYDQWRDIRFRPEHALWRDRKSPFQVELFHPGLYYNRTVDLNVVARDGVHPLPFSPSHFDYGKNDFASKVPQDLGYAGFRVHAPIKRRDYYDEVIVFLGASYFRAVGKDEVFGLSARGLAIDTGESWGEEFPWFKEFWLVTPAAGSKELTVYALLDSPSLAGAYRFVIAPGEQTAVNVECRLFLRKEVRKIGIAPLTSMFYHGENTTRWFPDFRPEAHDSDGVLLNLGSGEWLWRPLDNPRTLSVSGLQTEDPKGFGLLQRDRDFDHYQDLETRADRRPSVWIAPRAPWGKGRVEVVEIPTGADVNDNVVAYWVPATPAKPGEPAAFAYTMYWYGDDPSRPPGGQVVATRRDTPEKDVHRFVIDFAGGNLPKIPAERILRGDVTVVGGEKSGTLIDQHVVKNPLTGGWRLTFQVRPKNRDPVELRAFLDEHGNALTETWSYAIVP
jgi:periplasmic glucans biosynthesis protein